MFTNGLPMYSSSAQSGTVIKFHYIAFAFVVLIFLIHLALYYDFTVDDAFITFAYSRNLALGEGLRIAVGNPVEANSSFLWSVILAPGVIFGIDLDVFSNIIGVICGIGSIILVFVLTKRWNADSNDTLTSLQLAIIASFLTAMNSSFSLWNVYGMENGFVALLLLGSLYLFYKEVETKAGISSAFLIVALYMSRPEAFGYVLVYIAARFIYYFVYQEVEKRWLYNWFLLLVGSLVIYEAWGFYYYGYLLPTSAVAKVGASVITRLQDGLHYTIFGGHAAVLTVIGMVLFAFRLPKLLGNFADHRHLIFRSGLLASLLLMHSAFVLLSGGDWMPNARFWSQTVPLGAVFLITEMSYFSLFKRLDILLASLVMYVVLQLYCDNHFLAKVEKLAAAEQRAVKGMAEFLNTRYQPGDVVAASDIGLLNYHFKGKVLDWWGLADEQIGRSSEAAGGITVKTILERRPNYIVLYSNEPSLTIETTKDGQARQSHKFITNPEFTRQYKQIHYLHFWENRYHALFALQ